MLKTLKDLFQALVPPAPGADTAAAEHALQLATAVVLVEVMRTNAGVAAAERRAVIDALHEKFALAPDELSRLVELAEQTARSATDYYTFTSHINARFDDAQKLRMVEHMWRVAYADGRLSDHERHVLWRIADLLHVPHGAYVAAKLRARDAAGAA